MFNNNNAKKNGEVTVYNPFRDMDEFERNFFGYDPFFDDGFFRALAPERRHAGNPDNHPARRPFGGIRTDIRETENAYVLEAELPGFNKEDIGIDISNDTLTIKAEHNTENEEKDEKGKYIRCERTYGSFCRSFGLEGINAEDISAKYENGVLTLNLPKEVKSAPETRRLTIE